MHYPRFLTLVGLVLLVAALRLLPHPENFAPMMAVALFGGAMFHNRWLALGLPLAAMLISDPPLFASRYRHLGWESFSQQWHVYLALLVGGLLAMATLRHKRTPLRVLGVTLAASLFFFLFTNFALLYPTTLYPHTWDGVWNSYYQGLPFYRGTLAAGQRADFVVWGLEHPSELAYRFGQRPAARTIVGGRERAP